MLKVMLGILVNKEILTLKEAREIIEKFKTIPDTLVEIIEKLKK
jgi:hypothetical protein